MTATISSTIQPTISASIPGAAAQNPILDDDNPNLVIKHTGDNISESTTLDDSPNGEDGTMTGIDIVAGQVGNAFSYNAAADKIVCTDTANFGTTTDFTVIVLVDTTDATKNKALVDKRFHNGADSHSGWVCGMTTAGLPFCFVDDDILNAQATGTTAVNDGSPHMALFEFDRDGNMVVEVDNGAAEGTISMASIGDISAVAQLTIGNKTPQNASATSITNMLGTEEEIYVFDRLLIASEKTAVFDYFGI